MGVPLNAGGEIIGLFTLEKDQPDFFTQEHQRLAEALSVPAALTIQNALLFEDTRRRLKEVNTLYQIIQELTESLDLDQVLKQVVILVQDFFKCYYVQVYGLDQTTKELVLQQGTGQLGLQLKLGGHRLPRGAGIPGHVVITGFPFATNNVSKVPFFVPNDLLKETSAELALPVRTGERMLGVLDVHHRKPNAFTDHDVRLMTAIANQLGVLLERVMLYADLQTALQHEKSARAQMVQSEKLAALGRIVASVAHELNNPLQAIQNALFLVKSEGQLSDQAQQDLAVALGESNRMAELIARLRETYRPTFSEEFKPESLNNLVAEVQKLINTHLRHNNVNFEFEADPDLPPCAMIADQVKQVILNICLNAVEIMPNGGRITLKTRHQPNTKGNLLTVSDNGPGIPTDILPFIFDPFFTTKDGGTGLGLSISYDIIQRHSGHIDVESKPGSGTVFKIWLPIAPQATRPLPPLKG
jgi:signal transduction histidine kinase